MIQNLDFEDCTEEILFNSDEKHIFLMMKVSWESQKDDQPLCTDAQIHLEDLCSYSLHLPWNTISSVMQDASCRTYFLTFYWMFRRISFIDISTVRFCNLRFYISVLIYSKAIQCGKCQQIFMDFINKWNMVTLFKAFVYHFVLICPKDRRRAIHWKNYCWIIKIDQHCAGI